MSRSSLLVPATLLLLLSFPHAAPAAAGCRACDVHMRCVPAPTGAILCIEGPQTCAMSLSCFGLGGGGRIPDGPAEDLTTWSLFDASASVAPRRAALRAGVAGLVLGDDARTPGLRGAGPLADAALAFGREFAVTLADGMGEGFALKRSVEGTQVRIEVRAVRGETPGEVLASELLDERDELSVPVRVDGRDRVLVLHASSEPMATSAREVARLRRGLASAGRTLPLRSAPLLRLIAR
ncbi:MAG: hypothetical protein ABL977_10870 [Candidatus Eisenbacteria bacterium]